MTTAEDEIARARLLLRAKAPYFMHLILSLIPIATEEIPTLSTSASMVMRYNPKFIVELNSYEMVAGVIMHEASHVFRSHIERFDSVHPSLFRLANMAMDIALNPDLLEAGWKLPSFALVPSQYKFKAGLTAEEYFALLMKDPPPESQSSWGTLSGVCSGECGGVAGNSPDHEKNDSSEEIGGRDQVDINTIVQITAMHIQEYVTGNGRGSIPKSLVRLSELAVTPSKIPWQSVVASTLRRVTGRIKSGGMDLSMKRPSKRSFARGLIRPGLVKPTPEVCLIRDTSGSMGTEQLQSATNEMCAAIQGAGVDSAWFIDGDVHAAFVKKIRMIDIPTMDVHGGGGTSFIEPINTALRLKPKPDIIVYFTDGDGEVPEFQPVGVEVIWCIVKSYFNRAPTSWGTTIFIED